MSATTSASGAGGTAVVGEDPDCSYFCDQFEAICGWGGMQFGAALYPDRENCMSVCVTWEEGRPYDGENTRACRLGHLENGEDPPHCGHASESGGGQCPVL